MHEFILVPKNHMTPIKRSGLVFKIFRQNVFKDLISDASTTPLINIIFMNTTIALPSWTAEIPKEELRVVNYC